MSTLRNIFTGQMAPILLGLMACLLVTINLDVAEECLWTFDGPGLTLDENLNVASGVYVVESTLKAGLGALDPRTMQEIFNDPAYFPDYPPLGRLPLALSNAIFSRTTGLGNHPFYLITYARVGSAVTFGLLVALLVWLTGRHASPIAGLVAGVSLMLTPRVFGHAHLASVETTMNLMYALTVLSCVHLLSNKETLRLRDGFLPGLFLGLALLTKIQAIFLPPVIVIWILWHWRFKGVLPLLVLAITSAVVFLAGWPWLWADPVTRFWQYFAQTTDRAVLYCFYLGKRYADHDVPWHYPFVMFLITTPLPFLLLGGWGMSLSRKPSDEKRRSTRNSSTPPTKNYLTPRQNHLLLGAFWLPLIVFAIPGVPVYDGERLFLIVWPIFSIWIGVAAAHGIRRIDERLNVVVRNLACGAVFAIPLISMVLIHPCYLSFYDVQVGGLRGAATLGMEKDYWGGAVTAEFLESACSQLPEGTTLAVAPVLHPLFPQFLKQDSWLLNRPDINLVAYDDAVPVGPQHVLIYHRRADQWKSLSQRPAGTRILASQNRQGVILAELIKLPDPTQLTESLNFEQTRESQRRAAHKARTALIQERTIR